MVKTISFRPFTFCFVDRVEFKIFNRWGQLVWKTENPNLNWDGTNLKGKDLSEGVYYYTCRVLRTKS